MGTENGTPRTQEGHVKSVLVQCWLGGSEVMNLGEWFIEIILAKFKI